jgi:protein involved in polysaccharide export with SLBB domain
MRRIALLSVILCCALGCASWRKGTVGPTELSADVQAQAPTKLKSLQLAALGTPTHAEYQIHPGDLLEVTIADLVGENQFYPLPVRVLEDGAIRLPLAGPMTVAGLTFPEAEQMIFATYSSQGLLKKPLVTVSLKDTRKIRIFVLGAVNKPGQYDLNSEESDLLSALVAAGGLTGDANPVIEVRRRVQTDRSANNRRQTEPEEVPAASPTPVRRAVYTDAPGAPAARQSNVSSPYNTIRYPPTPSLPIAAEPETSTPSVTLTLAPPATLTLASMDEPIPTAPVSGTGTFNKLPQANTPNTPVEDPPEKVNRGWAPRVSPARSSASINSDQVIHLDLANESAKQKLSRGFYLQNGDTVTIEDRKARPIYVVGMVNKPGEYPMPVDRDMRVLEAVGLAGGVDRASLPNKALIVRQRPDGSGVVTVRIDLDKAKRDNAENIRLMQGDTLSVEETPASFTRGLLRSAIRFGFGASVSPAYGF